MRKRLRMALFVLIFASVGGIAYKVAQNFWVMKIREIETNPVKILDYLPEATLHVNEFRRTRVEGGRTVWEVAGQEAQYLKEQREAVIKQPRLVFYTKKGHRLEARAREGHLFFTEHDLQKAQLQGDAEIHYQGMAFHSDEVSFHKDAGRVVSPGKVTLKGDGIELVGVGMEADLEQEKLRLLKRVWSRLEPEQLRKLKVDGKKPGKA